MGEEGAVAIDQLRFDYIIYWVQRTPGSIINIGCKDVCYYGDAFSVQVDLDAWRWENMVQANAEHLPFKDGSFDIAILGEVLEHASSPSQMISEACRVTRKVVVGTTPNEREWETPHNRSSVEEDIAAHLDIPAGVNLVRRCMGFERRHSHSHIFTTESLKEVLMVKGWRGRIDHLPSHPPVFGFMLSKETV